MRISASLLPRSISLSAQLLLAFVGAVLVTTLALTVAAYRSSLETLVAQALRDVSAAARAREQTLTQLLTLRQQRAEGFLLSLESICAEPDEERGFGWSEECVSIMVAEFRMTERASAALLTFRGRTLSASGGIVQSGLPAPGALARIVRRGDQQPELLMHAEHGAAALTLQFDSRDVLPFFEDRSGLGRTGEVFLVDSDGEFLTPARYGPVEGTPPGAAIAESVQRCRGSQGEAIDIDYRGVPTIHGFRPVRALGGGCIDAHIAVDEALEPAVALRGDLVARGAVFAMLGGLISLLAAQRIAAPVRRLANTARELQAGNFQTRIPIEGPSEVQALGHAFSAMAGDLSKLVTREQAARREAETANRSKDQFLAVLSHELRTPLNAVLGWSKLLATGRLDPNRTRRAIDAIERNAAAQRRLIEDLLEVSRIVAGRLRMERGPVRIADVIDPAIDAVRPLAIEKSVVVQTTIEDRELIVMGDAERLQQIVWNLVSNGVKFTPAGGAVRVMLRRCSGHAELVVADTGAGINSEFLPHVFEWFRQADGALQTGGAGLGLGLGLVRQLAELHGGSARADSPGEGLGATFTVRLPLATE